MPKFVSYGHLIDVDPSIKTQQRSVKNEKHERLHVTVADAIASTRAMVVHPIHTTIASTAMVYSLNLERATTRALKIELARGVEPAIFQAIAALFSKSLMYLNIN